MNRTRLLGYGLGFLMLAWVFAFAEGIADSGAQWIDAKASREQMLTCQQLGLLLIALHQCTNNRKA